MSAGDDLEAALQSRWSFDELEVYADFLLSQQDVRGDIVALDLSPRPEHRAWVQKRHAALAKWLGAPLATRCGHLVQHGFLHELRDGMAPLALLDSDAGTYLRGYTTWGATRVRASLERLADKPRPWLSRLAIAHHGDQPMPEGLVAKLIAATPRLEEISIAGRPPFDAFPHPNVKRARLDTRCYTIETTAVKSRIDVPDGCPEPRLSDDDLDLLMQLVELASDCNQLYTHGEGFDVPLPALIARLAAAGLVELAGPMVRIASPGLALVPRNRPSELPSLVNARVWIEADRWLDIPDLRAHGRLVAECAERFPVPARLHDTLLDYHERWRRAVYNRVVIDGERCVRYRAALNALLELRGLWPLAIGAPEDWRVVEQLGGTIPLDGAYFRSEYYNWY